MLSGRGKKEYAKEAQVVAEGGRMVGPPLRPMARPMDPRRRPSRCDRTRVSGDQAPLTYGVNECVAIRA